MTNLEYLQSLIIEAQELLEHATAGGDREYAFDLWASTDDLSECFNKLCQFNYNVKDEVEAGCHANQ